MCSQETYTIDLKGLTEDVTVRDFDLDDEFFRALDGSQLEHGALHVSVSIRKMTGFFDFQFHTVGSVTVSCDRCLDDMEQPIDADNHLVVKLGDTYSEDDDTVTVDENEGMLDLSCRAVTVHSVCKCKSLKRKLNINIYYFLENSLDKAFNALLYILCVNK